MGKFMKEGPLDNWGFGTGIKLTRQELIEDARVQYVRAENILKSNTELIAKNDKLKQENAELKEALEELYKFILSDETRLITALRKIRGTVSSRFWMGNLECGVNGLSFDEFRNEFNDFLEEIDSIAERAETTAYPKYDDAMRKAEKVIAIKALEEADK
jgi:hypothetical protein